MGQEEEWRPVHGYEGLYLVSDAGRVQSVPRSGTRGGIIKADIGPQGYPSVRLSREGRKKHLNVHGLVARSFLGPRPEAGECRHINGDPADNRLENLAWGTSAENSQDMIGHGRTNSRRTHCPQGHEYNEENTHWYGGRRYCKPCNRVQAREGHKRRRASAKGKT